MFKKRNITKSNQQKIDLDKDLQEIQIHNKQGDDHEPQFVHQHLKTKKINKFVSLKHKQGIKNDESGKTQIKNSEQIEQKPIKQNQQPKKTSYGLLSKHHFKPSQSQKKNNEPHQKAFLQMYIQKRMNQIQKKDQKKQQQSNAEQILQMQKQYLAPQSKILQYDVKQIQKKLEKMANDTLKHQTENRINYLKNLLQNEHERMEYASKKELKMMKQQKDRIQKQLNSKYRQTGRRHFVQSLKNKSYI